MKIVRDNHITQKGIHTRLYVLITDRNEDSWKKLHIYIYGLSHEEVLIVTNEKNNEKTEVDGVLKILTFDIIFGLHTLLLLD